MKYYMEERNLITNKKLLDTKTIKKRPRIPKSYCQIFIIMLILLYYIFLLLENKRLVKIIFELNKNTELSKDTNAKIYKKLFQYKIDEIEYKNLDKIHISYSLDNKLTYPTLVSMVSGLENNNKNKNIIVYHLLLSHDFDTSNIEIFESLRKNYAVKINYYVIPHIFSYSKTWTAGTDCVYYKIILPIMFPDYKRIIYLDGDTLIRKDISEMFNLPFNGNYILGFPFFTGYIMDKLGINATHYINGGCLLFNIDKIRRDKKDVDLLQFTIKNNNVLRFREQDSINYVFYPKIGFLPLKYGIYMIGDKRKFKELSRYTRSPLNLTEGYEAVKDPAIVHFSCCWPKVWTEGSKNLFNNHNICLRYKNEFYYYANKTQYYSTIYNLLIHKKNL
jgi:lipopolysaccharide biosynthesis glycosyltransferase